MKLRTEFTDNMEVLYPGNLALLSMFLKNPENVQADIRSKDDKKKGEGTDSPDVLTCGVCQKDFLLADILRFIQHKVHCQANSREGGDQIRPLAASRTHNGDVGPESDPQSPVEEREESEETKTEEKRQRDDHSPVRKKARSMQDAEANTMDSEPARYVCGTCGVILSSAWSLVQHVQSSHGIIIYQETSSTSAPSTPPGVPKPSHSSPLSSVSSTATTSSAPTPHLPLPLLDPTKVDLTKVDLSKIVSPVTSTATPLPPHPPVAAPLLDPTHPFNLLRMPLGDARAPFSPSFTPPFVRPGHDFRMDQLLHEGLRLNPGLLPPHFERQPFLEPGLGASRPSAPTPISSGGDPNLDFYSQRLRQLASTTSPTSSTSPRKPLPTPPPPFSSPNGPTPSTPVPTQTPTSTRSDQASQMEKRFKCESCSKRFRWESNLVIHQSAHTGEKDFRCQKCSESLPTVEKLRAHLRAHRKAVRHESSSPDSSRPQADDENDRLSEDEDEDDEEDEDGEEEEELNASGNESIDDEDEDIPAEDIEEDTPEDLSTPKLGQMENQALQNVSSSTLTEVSNKQIKIEPKSVVGELMDKFGLANITAYSEAYQQALRESGRFMPQSLLARENAKFIHANGIEKTLKIREDLAKGIISSHPSIDLAHQSLLGAFDNPYDAQKRLNNRENAGLYAGLWLPTLAGTGATHRDLFPSLSQSDGGFLQRKLINDGTLKSVDTTAHKPGTSAATPATLSLVPQIKKESRRNDTCEYCGKIFKNCSNLTVHRRSHTGEKPYKCDLCSYACAQSSKLTRHMKTHGRMGKDVYRCRFCDMPFSVASTLEKHMRKCVVNQNSKGLFTPISAANHDGLEAYKGIHFTPVINDDSPKPASLFPNHFTSAAASNTSDDNGDSSNLSGPGS